MAQRLEGKVAVISGGGRGLGLATARLFAREGASVVIGQRDREEGERAVALIQQDGGRACFVHLDVTQEDMWRHIVSTASQRFGRLDILVNNAGAIQMEGVEDLTQEVWDRTIAVNQTGTWLGMKTAIPAMRKGGGGSIVNVASIAGLIGHGQVFAYQASKGAVVIMTKSAAIQYAREKIRVNTVIPGPADTVMFGSVEPVLAQQVKEQIPLGRIGKPEEVAYGVLYLASDEAAYVTGAELVIDGGFTAQ
ncbi:2,5-dichloro-2,5-cyclohexadiene-1,4-diol dehydrogenase [Nitrospira sp. KM1]|uniref:SDR family NAD(P)-dependent oxidoreductase n=1 Tax=Nitrospira sp. KM1 TaxID=1936990 RepID=UPI0013A72C93|nr:glucose 1-dehydrogenase [Nitrospira sp. KM1]BCA56461.1 2,5-dichloro-2,5-cyclohexadiene-1,4-diol dehydrogenase [Nitrospira sp. KM1]